MDYHYCGVVQVRGVHDPNGLSCAQSATTICYDCGTSLCSPHAERCELCGKTFCQSCVSFYQSEHAKPAQTDQTTSEFPKRKTA